MFQIVLSCIVYFYFLGHLCKLCQKYSVFLRFSKRSIVFFSFFCFFQLCEIVKYLFTYSILTRHKILHVVVKINRKFTLLLLYVLLYKANSGFSYKKGLQVNIYFCLYYWKKYNFVVTVKTGLTFNPNSTGGCAHRCQRV